MIIQTDEPGGDVHDDGRWEGGGRARNGGDEVRNGNTLHSGSISWLRPGTIPYHPPRHQSTDFF